MKLLFALVPELHEGDLAASSCESCSKLPHVRCAERASSLACSPSKPCLDRSPSSAATSIVSSSEGAGNMRLD